MGARGDALTALYLNLDAEDELARGGAFGRARSAATLDAMRRAAARLAPFLPTRIVPFVPGTVAQAGHVREVASALCWCPTPSALREVQEAGWEPVATLARALGRADDATVTGALSASVPPSLGAFPSVGALTRANERATFALVSPLVTAVGTSSVARSFEAAEAHLVSASLDGNWILRRGLSAAGRGARRLRGGAKLAAGDAAWLRASLALGPVTLDPRVELVRELALHGWLTPEGEATLGRVCLQRVDPHGAWLGTECMPDGVVEDGDDVSEWPSVVLGSAAARVAATLHALGYHGPFGIDAYIWRDLDGSLHLRAPSEVNARYSMGWWTGMGAR